MNRHDKDTDRRGGTSQQYLPQHHMQNRGASQNTQGLPCGRSNRNNRTASHSSHSLDDVRVLEVPKQRDLP